MTGWKYYTWLLTTFGWLVVCGLALKTSAVQVFFASFGAFLGAFSAAYYLKRSR